MARSMRVAAGSALLLFQIAMIAYARLTPARYFCWAPYDMQTEYWLSVRLEGRELSAPEIRQRYRRPAHGVDNRSAQHVIDIVAGVEKQRAAERAAVQMRYRINGKREEAWQWPPNP